MLARRQPLRQPLLWAFAGGCLSGAVLIEFWRGDSAPLAPDAASGPAATPHRELARVYTVARERDTTQLETAPAEPTADIGAEAPAEPGSSVADVLLRLEAAYRDRLAAAAPPQPAATVADTKAPEQPPHEEAPTTLAALTAAPKLVPPTRAPPTAALEPNAPAPVALQANALAPAPVTLPTNAPAPATLQGDAHAVAALPSSAPPTVTAHQSDAYLAQQLAILQYMQLLALSPYARVASSSYAGRGVTRRAPAFQSTLTNPDNPWGYDFPPTILVK